MIHHRCGWVFSARFNKLDANTHTTEHPFVFYTIKIYIQWKFIDQLIFLIKYNEPYMELIRT